MTEPNIEVQLTNEREFHCFKIIFRVKTGPEEVERIPVEINLHTTQAIELFHQLAVKLAEYMNKASGELLRIKQQYP